MYACIDRKTCENTETFHSSTTLGAVLGIHFHRKTVCEQKDLLPVVDYPEQNDGEESSMASAPKRSNGK